MPGIHICFWFLVPEAQAGKLSGKTLLALLEGHDATVHSIPSAHFEGYALLSVRYRPPNPDEWKRRYDIDIFGITGGLDDIPPYEDLVAAISTRRDSERRARPRVGGISEEDALAYCRSHGHKGYELGVGEFKRHGHLCTLWVLFSPNGGTIQGVLIKLKGAIEVQWCGADGLWPFLHMQAVKLPDSTDREVV